MVTFKDLKFEPRQLGGVGATHTFDNGNTISIQASKGAYSTPREDLSSPDEYSSFEVAVWDKDGEWVTRDFMFDYHDDVLGWQGRDEINALIQLINK